jgi:tetratricopeptide (TPR) repeat protein
MAAGRGYGETARAIQVYQRGIRLNPNRYDLYYDLGFAYFNKRQYEQALPYLEKAVQFANAPAFVWKTLAHCYERLERYQQSLRAWEKAKQLDPSDGAVETQHAARAPKTPRATRQQFVNHRRGGYAVAD